MKSLQVHEYGEPVEVLQVADAPDPVAADGQVLVRVLAAAANFADVLMCRGQYQDRPPFPFTPGIEVCGEIVALGPDSDAAGLRVGDRVLGTPARPTGGFGELALMEAPMSFRAPDALDDAQAAALYIGYQTGWFALHRRVQLRAGQTLLVHAAAGGVGSAAVQLGKAAGATVIGVVGGPAKAETARALGADLVIDRRTEDVIDAVKEATAGRGVDVVFDPVGGEAYAQSAKCVAFEGSILVIGFAGGDVPRPALNHALVKNYSIVGVHWGLYRSKDPIAVRACHEELTRLADRGAVSPLVSERLGLEQMPAGLQRLASGDTIGRVVYEA
jgi:NADPH2:quinone reductase